MELSIIIITYNSERVIKACLQSVYKNIKGISFEVLVIDNNSQDSTVEVVKNNFPQVVLSERAENLGFANGVNYGFKNSTGQSVLLLNPDTVLLGKAVGSLLHVLKNDQKTGIVGGQLLYPDYKIQASFGNYPSSLTELLQALFINKILPFGRYVSYNVFSKYWFSKVLEPDWVSGGFMMIKREVINQVGLFDEKFFLYLEDIDYCQRARQADWKIVYYPQAKIIHHHMDSSKKDHSAVIVSEVNSLMYYFKKNKLDTTWLVFFIYLRIYVRLVSYVPLSLFSEYHKNMLKANKRALMKLDI